MKRRVIEKLSAVCCALCLAAGVMGGFAAARGEEKPAEPDETPVAREEIEATAEPAAEEFSYTDTDVYWLSHFIYAAAGDRSLDAQTAVGGVVIDRVMDEAYAGQDSVYDVIFAKNQFDVVINGMIYMEPSEDAVTAARLVLNGGDTARGAVFFSEEEPDGGAEVTARIDGLVFYK